MWHVQRALAVSERRAYQVVGQARSTQRYEFKRWDLDQQLCSGWTSSAENGRGTDTGGYGGPWSGRDGE